MRTLGGGVVLVARRTAPPATRLISPTSSNQRRLRSPAADLSREARAPQSEAITSKNPRPQARFLFSIFLFFKKRNVAAGGR
ncbi:MAG: hypothetical protein IKJ65_06475, partial [Clostridia bacterium]|nr:hypothetical protein [Clostridia bacterium]